MCKIIFLYFLYLICTNSFYVYGFNETVGNLLKNGNSIPGTGLAGLGKKSTFLPRFEAINHTQSNDKDAEDGEDQSDEDDEEHMDDKNDTVDTALNEAEERHSDEEQKLEEAEGTVLTFYAILDVGLEESINEEKAESSYASKATEAGNNKTKEPGNSSLRYLMDQMVKLSLELKQITNEINLLA